MWQRKRFCHACRCACWSAFFACGTALAASQSAAAPPSAVAGPPPGEQAKIDSALSQMKQHQDAKALDLFGQVLAADPDNAQVNLLAAGAAIENFQPDLALKYAEKAHQLDPNAWQVHLTLLVADAGANRIKERDEERQLVRQFHSDGKHPDATQANGFMVDYFPLKSYRVRAVEYFSPIGKQHFAYRFLVYDQQRTLLWTVTLESDDLDQTSWATAHAELAKRGEREYSLEGYGVETHTTYRNYSGKPSYDDTKADVVKILNEHALPVAPPGR